MSVIKFNFAKFDKAVAFQVLEQDPEFSGRRYVSTNGITLSSRTEPSIQSNREVYLRGTNNPLKTVIHYFNSDAERDTFYKELIFALDELSKNRDRWERM